MVSLTGAKVVLTDLPEVLPLLQLNIDVNKSMKGSAKVLALDWYVEDLGCA